MMDKQINVEMWMGRIALCLIAVSYLCMAIEPDLRLAVPALAGETAVIVISICLLSYLGARRALQLSPATIMCVAAFLRLLFLFRPPELSDDIFRYLWDGLQTLAGNNPYATAPDHTPCLGALALLRSKINHSHLVTIYPPAAQIFFAAGAALNGGVLGMKLCLVIVDLVTCGLILWLLARLNLPPWRAIVYAWHPLSVLEIAGSGHIDGAGICFFLVAASLLMGGLTNGVSPPFATNVASLAGDHRPPWFSVRALITALAGMAFSFASLVKLLPLLFLPGLLMLIGRRGYSMLIVFVLGLVLGAVMLIYPFAPELQNSLETLSVYFHNWEFASYSFRMLRNIGLAPEAARRLLAACFCALALLQHGRLLTSLLSKTSELHENPVEESRAWLVLFQSLYCLVLAFLLLSPTLHPWYGLPLVALLPFAPRPAGLALSWSLFLAYRVLILYSVTGSWMEDDATCLMTWSAPLVAGLVASLFAELLKRNSHCVGRPS